MHRKPIDLKTPSGRDLFYNSREWHSVRAIKLAKDPHCEEHLKQGINELATEVHHKVDLKNDPTIANALGINGLESLCKSCHSKITWEENKEKSNFGKKKEEFVTVNRKWNI